MAAFEIGQRVKVVTSLETDHHGDVGTICGYDIEDEELSIEVSFASGDTEFFSEKELAPTEAPAAQNRDTGWPQRDLDELGFSAMGLTSDAGSGAAVIVSRSNSYDDDDVDDMIGALLRIAETLGLEHVSATQIADAVDALQAAQAQADVRGQDTEAE